MLPLPAGAVQASARDEERSNLKSGFLGRIGFFVICDLFYCSGFMF